LAQRYGFSQEAVIHMMFAMLRGRGGMAQFNHPEFAGSGQWMRGGMLMLGDMFNHSLKARVDGLCQAIASQLSGQPELFPSGTFQAQSQSGAGQRMEVSGGGQRMQTGGLFAPDPRDTWWPSELGSPSAIGSQNDMRYAFFPAAGRLAVEANVRVSVYDTGEHQIAGLSQQQGPGGAVVFSTPGGSVSLASLASTAGGALQQAQSSGGGSQQQQVSTGVTPGAGLGSMAPMAGLPPMGGMGAMAPMTFSPMGSAEPWWPKDLGSPSSTGAQNELRYAFFPAARRLAVEVNGTLSLHDTGDMQISGCSQDGGAEGVRFTTGSGSVALSTLPEVRHAASEPEPQAAESARDAGKGDVLDALARLGALRDKGILTEEDFASKKADLLRRL
ncbi:MAG: SHOCT domain-containing protein, partial [Cyanobium sp.]